MIILPRSVVIPLPIWETRRPWIVEERVFGLRHHSIRILHLVCHFIPSSYVQYVHIIESFKNNLLDRHDHAHPFILIHDTEFPFFMVHCHILCWSDGLGNPEDSNINIILWSNCIVCFLSGCIQFWFITLKTNTDSDSFLVFSCWRLMCWDQRARTRWLQCTIQMWCLTEWWETK